MLSVIPLPPLLQRRLDTSIRNLLCSAAHPAVDFTAPLGAPALLPATSLSWRIFKNPVALFVGGTAAVLMELAEPRVRAGVWEHSSFRRDPAVRLGRTGMAAMVTIYGPRTLAESMISRIVRMHGAVHGTTAAGGAYSANDPALLAWVHATAAYSFAAAYSHYVATLDDREVGALYREGTTMAHLYGAPTPPQSVAAMHTVIESMRPTLGASPIVFDFLRIMRETPILPIFLRSMQASLVRAAVELLPHWIRLRLGLGPEYVLTRHERWMIRFAGAASDRIILPTSPAVQACVRLGLGRDYLYH